MTLTQNYYYQGPAGPGATVVPTEFNLYKDIRRLNATADVGDLLPAGTLCYLTATTNATDMTPCVTEHGEAAAENFICIVEIKESDPYIATTTEKAVYPNRMTNASCTITEYTPAANTNIIVIPLEEQMNIWVLGSADGSFDTTFGTTYISAANGLIKAEGQPTGAAPDGRAMSFVSLATTSNQNWAFVRFLGPRMYDKA